MSLNPVSVEPEQPSGLEAEVADLRQRLARAEDEKRLLLSSLRHRVRNVLAVVRSIVRRTAPSYAGCAEFQAHLDARLDAIARMEEMALRDADEALSLSELLSEEFLAHAVHEGEQLSIAGPLVRLKFTLAGPLSLAIHELAVNALTHGALSTQHGHVGISWTVETADSGPVLRLDWRETGVAPAPHTRRPRGFGTEIIERTLPYETGATTSLVFESQAFNCRIALPVTKDLLLDDAPSDP